jgi:hypothetical protein
MINYKDAIEECFIAQAMKIYHIAQIELIFKPILLPILAFLQEGGRDRYLCGRVYKLNKPLYPNYFVSAG